MLADSLLRWGCVRGLLLVVLSVGLFARTVRAAPDTGLVVIGDADQRAPARQAFEQWLLHHGHAVQKAPLDQDAIVTIANCLQMQDPECARMVVEKRGRTDGVVFAQVAVTKEHAVTLDVYWIVKGHEAVAERRACEDCTPDALAGTVDAIMTSLAASSATGSGRLVIRSRPAGLTVVIDKAVVGVTPLQRDVGAGHHDIVLMKGTQRVGGRSISLHATEVADLAIPVHLTRPRSRVPGGIALGVGLTAIAVGGVMYALSPTDDGSHYHYRDYRPPAIGVAIGGAAVAIAGALLWMHERHPESVPIASIDAHGGTIGWARAF